MVYALIIAYMAITARMSGGGLGAKYLNKKGDQSGVMPFDLTFFPEVMFAAGFAAAVGQFSVWASFIVLAWCYIWMQTGHGIVLPWGEKLPEHDRNRTQTLSPVVDFLADILGIQKTQADGYSRTLNYCRLFMAVKGFLIGLPVGGFITALGWPLAYEIGARLRPVTRYSHNIAELATGIVAGLSIVAFLLVVQ